MEARRRNVREWELLGGWRNQHPAERPHRRGRLADDRADVAPLVITIKHHDPLPRTQAQERRRTLRLSSGAICYPVLGELGFGLPSIASYLNALSVSITIARVRLSSMVTRARPTGADATAGGSGGAKPS